MKKTLWMWILTMMITLSGVFCNVSYVEAFTDEELSTYKNADLTELSDTDITLTVGFKKQLSTVFPIPAEWSCDDLSVISYVVQTDVDSAGCCIMITGVSPGETTITANLANGQVLTCKVTVTANEYTATKITNKMVSSGKWGAEAYNLSYTGTSGWEDVKVKVCVVNNTGKTLTSLKNIKINVKQENGDLYTKYTQDYEELNLKSGESKTLTFTIENSWLDYGKHYPATVIHDLRTYIKSVTFTAEAWGLTGRSGVENTSTPTLNRSDVTLYINKSYTLKVTNSDKKVKWSSSNKKVASVSSSGKVTGKSAGAAIITAKVGNKSLKCRVVVAYGSTSSDTYRLTITNKISGSAKDKCSESKYLVMYWGTNTFSVSGDCKNVEKLYAVVQCYCGLEFTKNETVDEHMSLSGHGRYWVMYNAYTFTLGNNQSATITGLKKNKDVRICRIYDSEPTGVNQTLMYSYNNGAKKDMGVVRDVNWSDGITNLSLGLKKNSSLVIYNTATTVKKYGK